VTNLLGLRICPWLCHTALQISSSYFDPAVNFAWESAHDIVRQLYKYHPVMDQWFDLC
jgi:hypothetical protein